MDYFFGDGVGEPTQWQGAPELTLGAGAADALWLDFDGDGSADDALWDSDLDGVADRVVLDVGAGGQEVYADDGRGVWNAYAGGAGALVAGSAGSGSVGFGSTAGGSVGVGSVSGGSLAAGSVLAGAAGAGALVDGAVAAGSEALGSMPDWGTLLADAVGALDHGSLESESARWSAPPVIEPEPAPRAGDTVGNAPSPVPEPAPGPVPPNPVQGGTVPEPAPPVFEADGSLTVDTGSGLLSVADVDGDGHLDSALPVVPVLPQGSLEVGAIDAGALGVGSAAAGSVVGGSVAAGSIGVGS